jgi:DNA repair protein RadD
MFELRPYQQRACDAALAWMRTSIDPCLIEAAPAAGKSFMVAYVAKELNRISGGKSVLCLMPSATLLSQNVEKYRLTGEQCSIFSAGAGAKSTRHKIVMATPGTVKRSISRFQNNFCAVIIDEAHGLTPTILSIIESMREGNPSLRVLGLTGTPYRRQTGYIFRLWPDGKSNDDETTRDPFFVKNVYRVTASNAETYDASQVMFLPNGKVDDASIERAYVGHGRKSASIINDVIERSRHRKGGIMYFASTIQHAREIMASLPPENSALVTGEEDNNKAVIKAYKEKRIRHLVSVGMLATGFDVSHTETIALLRYTDSASLLTQLLGRAWRLDSDKKEAVVLDYSSPSNIERHFPDGDIYTPVIRAKKLAEAGNGMKAICVDCGHENSFTANPAMADYAINENGYCLDVFGEIIMTDFGPMPAHYGRRCFGMVRTGSLGQYDRCKSRWTGKPCPQCGELQDIAARYCGDCGAECVDPGKKLAMEFATMKKDSSIPQTDLVLTMDVKESISQRGNKTVKVDWKTPWRHFTVWYSPESKHPTALADWRKFQAATEHGTPETVSYVKQQESSFFRTLAFNQPEDVAA